MSKLREPTMTNTHTVNSFRVLVIGERYNSQTKHINHTYLDLKKPPQLLNPHTYSSVKTYILSSTSTKHRSCNYYHAGHKLQLEKSLTRGLTANSQGPHRTLIIPSKLANHIKT